jgi:hypothetical protein
MFEEHERRDGGASGGGEGDTIPKNLSTNYVLFNRVWVKLIQIMVSEEVGQSS